MTVKVLIVDDSGFFRRRVSEILSEDPLIEVAGFAVDGKDAIAKVAELKPDVITMDIEMPIMDGITATKEIMSKSPLPILMFSSLTTDGAKATLDALEAGAVDFLPKRFEDISKDRDEAKKLLCERVRAVVRSKVSVGKLFSKSKIPKPVTKGVTTTRTNRRVGKIKLLAIGTSTGGPVALQQVLTQLPANFPVPIILIQHMPSTFTQAFSQRLDKLCEINVKQADDGDIIEAGTAYLAPGGKQMLLTGSSLRPKIQIKDGEKGLTYKPSVDVTFNSVANVFPNETLAIILTGMGADGRDGAVLLNKKGSTIWAQDEASCVVYGMPAAVAEAGIVDKVLTLSDIGSSINNWL
ncbi:Chemotaxis response regulator protein-glutamate methylesterase CheB [hydrothermal vent metagenome]|uniref:protein-glutamate methylesterase n=1 Tax=hydrothermal vent metagenome TaxID=652676 RepID=A0A3B1AJZ3_9ZZZZ